MTEDYEVLARKDLGQPGSIELCYLDPSDPLPGSYPHASFAGTSRSSSENLRRIKSRQTRSGLSHKPPARGCANGTAIPAKGGAYGRRTEGDLRTLFEQYYCSVGTQSLS